LLHLALPSSALLCLALPSSTFFYLLSSAVIVRRWYYYRDRYCKATEVEERAGRRLVLRRIATLGSHLVRTIDIHAAKSLLA
jgi:hypothetical protein